MPTDKGFETRVGDPTPEEMEKAHMVSAQKSGITGQQALKTSRWWLQWLAGMTTMIGAAAFSAQFVDYYTGVTGSSDQATTIYSAALGTLILGKFLLGVFSDVLHAVSYTHLDVYKRQEYLPAAVIPPSAEILAGKCDRGLVKRRDHEICKIFIV